MRLSICPCACWTTKCPLWKKYLFRSSIQFLIRILLCGFFLNWVVWVICIFLYYILWILSLYHSCPQPLGHQRLMTGLMEDNFSTDGGVGDGSGGNANDGGDGSGGNVSIGEWWEAVDDDLLFCPLLTSYCVTQFLAGHGLGYPSGTWELRISALSDISFANISSHSVGCHFVLSVASFDIQKVLI